MSPSVATRDRVARVLREEIAPALGLDIASLEVLGATGGVVQVRLGGAWSGCPSTLMTIINGIEQELRRQVPEVKYIEVVA